MLKFLREYPITSVWIAVGFILNVGSRVNDAYNFINAGLPAAIWEAIGAAIFFLAVFVLLYRWHEAHDISGKTALIGTGQGKGDNKEPSPNWTDHARLTLTFDNELHNASPTTQKGVRYFYWYHFPSVGVNFETRQIQTNVGYVMVFMSLNDPTHTNYSQARVVGGGVNCEIVGMHAAGAVVRAMGDMRGKTLDIQFGKEPIPI